MNGVWTAPPTLNNCPDSAAAYVQPYPDNLMIITGGLSFQEKYTEAQCMDHYLRTTYPQLRNQIIPEDRSTSTAQNLLYLQIVLKQDLRPDRHCHQRFSYATRPCDCPT
ncbi:ElyC/SanA/YdcF family protein [Acinetobacter sp. S4400-12]|uniref:YdcF family protein n=1 Tax=Acinetobacter lwoffii TaxID=28090 RepID=A0A9D2ZYL2_ACILW|nr:YdcF family protein [Acinetobacter indicus]TQR62987.1 YdcF family protein [Acinetobacter sp. RF14B]HJF27185.1 YdcF family protein [Acinetobacter lwoffii]